MAEQWNFADIWDEIARRFPQRSALVHGDHDISWGELGAAASGLARTLTDAGLSHQGKVALYQRNSPSYLVSIYGVFAAAMVPVNTNFRYGQDELTYLWTDSDTEAVIFDAEFTEMAGRVRPSVPKVRAWICIGSASDCPTWAIPYEQAVADPGGAFTPAARSGDDIFLLYTGGTTGKPKGVMWRQDDLFRSLEHQQGSVLPDRADAGAFVDGFAGKPVRVLPAAPLMHGTACWFVLPVLARGGSVVTLTSHSLDAAELLDAIVARQVKGLCIAGNAFARPLLDALDANPSRWDLSGLRAVTTSGAILSEDYKRRLMAYAPRTIIVDSLGSSESGSIARAISKDAASAGTKAAFTPLSNARVVDEEGRDVAPGSGRTGRLALSGFIPVGYYGDAEKTAATFVTLDGRRYVIPGDLAEVAADGTIRLLGRGSSCINTAGEKVYPEEVEEVLKTLPGVLDAGVFGTPDDRLGEAVTAVVLLDPETELDEPGLIREVKQKLAGYKAPRRVFATTSFPRGPNGKLEFAKLRAIAADGTRQSTTSTKAS
jgi:acyl-CoA synthetase (AMP-forming)/AMP-acid ligase II